MQVPTPRPVPTHSTQNNKYYRFMTNLTWKSPAGCAGPDPKEATVCLCLNLHVLLLLLREQGMQQQRKGPNVGIACPRFLKERR